MKLTVSLVTCLTILVIPCLAQNLEKSAPRGFDSLRMDIPKGKIDTITYESGTVGTHRRALIYTPPGFSKRKKYPVLYLLHGIGGDEKEWLNGRKYGLPFVHYFSASIASLLVGPTPRQRMGCFSTRCWAPFYPPCFAAFPTRFSRAVGKEATGTSGPHPFFVTSLV